MSQDNADAASFQGTAPYYDLLAEKAGRLEREGPFLLDLAVQAPGKRFVDLACGTGLHALYLAEHGMTVDAFDLSNGMVEYARKERPHPGIIYGVADMRRVEGGPWDVALCLGNSLSLLRADEGLHDMLSSTFASLAPGGLLVTQTLNYARDSARQPRHRVETATMGEAEVVAVKNLVPRGDTTYLALTFFIEEAEEVRTLSDSAVLRNWRADELAGTAEGCGYRVEQVLGGYDGRGYSPAESSDIVLVLRKPA